MKAHYHVTKRRHFEIGENKPYLTIRIHKEKYFNWIIISLNEKLVNKWSTTKLIKF